MVELEERLEVAFNARTYGDLQPITRDLPQGPYPIPGNPSTKQWKASEPATTPSNQPVMRVTPGAPAIPSKRINALLSHEERVGQWEVPERLEVMVVCGSLTLDLTDATVRPDRIVISGAVLLGNVDIIAPEGMDVTVDDGSNFLGERKVKLRGPVNPESPALRVTAMTALGELKVRPPKQKRRWMK